MVWNLLHIQNFVFVSNIIWLQMKDFIMIYQMWNIVSGVKQFYNSCFGPLVARSQSVENQEEVLRCNARYFFTAMNLSYHLVNQHHIYPSTHNLQCLCPRICHNFLTRIQLAALPLLILYFDGRNKIVNFSFHNKCLWHHCTSESSPNSFA